MMSKRYGAEVLGTFGIVFAPVALSKTWEGPSGLLAAALVSGLAVMAMIYTFGPISAAHFNPAVTLGFAVAGRFPKRYVLPYWICQLIGAVIACAVVDVLFGGGGGVHIPASSESLRNLGIEIVLSFFLMIVVIAVATDNRVNSTVPALAVGLTVVLLVLVGGNATGASMNPARSFGPAVFAGGEALSNLWLYLVAPPMGAALGALAYEAVRIDRGHAKGAPNELLEALEELKAQT